MPVRKITSISPQAKVDKLDDVILNIVEPKRTVNVKQTKYSKIKVEEVGAKYMVPRSVLPFRVSFTTIDQGSGYGPSNPAPIGIAIIGLNNYIL